MKNLAEWRRWLKKHHSSESEIWLVFYKVHTGAECIGYEDSIEEALCWGWVDSLVKRLDDERYARKFTPRKPESKWSTVNRKRYEKMQALGRVMAAGVERPPTERSGDAPRPSLTDLPRYIEAELKSDARVWEFFENLSPSCKRAYLSWIDSAKREETKEKRLREAIAMMSAGKKLGLK